MKKGCALLLAVLMVLTGSAALALGKELNPGFTMPPPQEVVDHVAESFPTYTLEDYLEVTGTPDGDYGFALLTAGDERALLGYEEKDGRMRYWLKNAGAVPQGGKGGWFYCLPKGETYYGEDYEAHVSDGLSFTVFVSDGESYRKHTSYRWEDGGFKLTGYRDWDVFYGNVDVDDGVLHFSNWLEGWDFGKAYGTVQRDLRYVSYNALPRTVEEAQKELSTEPTIPQGGLLKAKKVKFTGGQKYPVYTGPGEGYARSGNGRGLVSTNDWIQVFGQVGDYIMIQYDISADRYRIGWIDADALPRGKNVGRLTFGQGVQTIKKDCTLTDDPLNSCAALLELQAGAQVTNLCNLGDDWVYVQANQENARYCGFVPSWALEE